jgi:hypothetical protein
LLAAGFASPAETALAEVGNFLVRDRVRRILEMAAPGACAFHATAERKSQKPTAWWLAVPKTILQVPGMKPISPFCPKCRQPKQGYWPDPKKFGAAMKAFHCGGADVFKGLTWNCSYIAEDSLAKMNRLRKKDGTPPADWSFYGIDAPSHPGRWTRKQISRDLYFSVRLERLLKRAKVRGQLVKVLEVEEVQAAPEDDTWIEEKLALLGEQGLVEAKSIAGKKTSPTVEAWFRSYLKSNSRRRGKPIDFPRIERKLKAKLPQNYKDFISAVGPKSFKHVNDTEGFTVHVLAPSNLDFRSYRRGRIRDLDEEQSQIDGVMFASTEHGDCFVFDISPRNTDYPVFWYDHEQNSLEPFAGSFAECMHRFSKRN